MSVVQAVEIPDNHRLTVKVPNEVPAGKTILTYTAYSALSTDTDKNLECAEKTWAYNHSHTEELKEKLEKLHGKLGDKSFHGLDGVSYQRKVRDAWDAN